MKRIACAVAVLSVLAAGCGSNSAPTAPTPAPTPVAACVTNNTAVVTFENRSNSSRTYDILWDGVHTATLAVGEKSSPATVAAGVQHTLVFKYTNTSTYACSPSTPTPAQCSSMNYYCTY